MNNTSSNKRDIPIISPLAVCLGNKRGRGEVGRRKGGTEGEEGGRVGRRERGIRRERRGYTDLPVGLREAIERKE